ncbi:hypothetical protein BJX99DRAFT_255546 [Aspergillus californicus]
MPKDSENIQVTSQDPDIDQVTRIPLELGHYRVTIAIATVSIFTGSGLLPVILYLVLTRVARLKLWIVFTILAAAMGAVSVSMMLRRTWRLIRSNPTCRPYSSRPYNLDYFQWNFFTGFCYIAGLMIAAVSTSPGITDTSTRLISLPLPLLILQVSSQLLCASVMNRMKAKYPFRVSSMDQTALVRPGVYTIVEDVMAVDCGQEQEYRRLLDARYCTSKPIRTLLERLDLAWGLSGAVVATVLVPLISTLPSTDAVFLIAPASSPGPFEDLLQPGLCAWDTVNHFIIQGSSTGSLSEACIPDISPVVDPLQIDTIIRLGSPAVLDDSTGQAPKVTREKGFLDALKLYSALHNNCRSTTLDLLTEAGQYEVRSVSKVFDELSQAAFLLQADTLPSSSSLRSNVSETKIIRVAIVEAIQVSIGIIQYNFQLHHSTTAGPVDGGLRCPSEAFCFDRPDSRHNGVPKPCNCLVATDEKRLGIQLDCLELLIHLEVSLIRLRHVMSKVECLHAGQQLPPQRLNCTCWVNLVPEINTARSQVSALLKQFRNLWD